MDLTDQSQNDNIRKIEDIIDIQKAKGNYSNRQVAFSLPSETDSAVSAGLARSLESGLSKTRGDSVTKKKFKKPRSKRQKSPLPDVVSWPSDSDITVLRMKLCLGAGAGGEHKVGDAVPGDGLHQPDGSSMINLATLVLQSRSPSKHSLNTEEYLLPLTSWEPRPELGVPPPAPPPIPPRPVCYELDRSAELTTKQSGPFSQTSRKSKVAQFLRLYFCPCCTCLYEIEKMRDEPSSSVYWSKRRLSSA